MKKLGLILSCLMVLMSFGCRTGASEPTGKRVAKPSLSLIEKAVSRFDAKELKGALQSMLNWHETHHSKASTALQSGLSRNEIISRLQRIECNPPEEYLILYEWRNGTSNDDHPLLWYHSFMSIERALAERKTMIKLLGPSWKSTWLPIFSYEGEYYFIDCPLESAVALPVYYFFLEEPEITYAYVNLTTMIKTAEELMRSDVVSLQNNFAFDNIGVNAIYEVYRKHNKGTKFPYAIERPR